MALLLFVRSIDDVMPAVEAASEFLAYKQNLEGNRQSEDLLAIWIDDDLKAALPAWSVSRLGTSSDRPTTTPISLRQSSSLSGIWTLCWIDISPSESEHGGKSPRSAYRDVGKYFVCPLLVYRNWAAFPGIRSKRYH